MGTGKLSCWEGKTDSFVQEEYRTPQKQKTRKKQQQKTTTTKTNKQTNKQKTNIV